MVRSPSSSPGAERNQAEEPLASPSGRVLLVEDTPSMARVYVEYLKETPWPVDLAETGAEARAMLAAGGVVAVILDLYLPDVAGLDLLREIRAASQEMAVVVVTSQGSLQVAVEAMRDGADDFLTKPFAADRLRVTLRNAVERHAMAGAIRRIKRAFGREAFHGFIGSSLAMQGVYRTIEAAARSRASVFITGESGTGKEVCATALHQASDRGRGPFVALNCAAIPHDLIESEIFGHVKGAFTGATGDREGAAVRANGGTLFLDEICEMDLALQAKLLRFIQTGTLQPVGGSRLVEVDVRFICATNRDPWVEVGAGRFREDLYFRLHVIPIHLPPLRDRDRDVVEIARALLERYAAEEGRAFQGFTPEAEDVLASLPWPGNVRQLQNVLRNVVVLNEGPLVTEAMLDGPRRQAGEVTRAAPGAGAPSRGAARVPAMAGETGGETGIALAAPAPVTLDAGTAGAPTPPAGGLEAVRQAHGLRPMWQVEWETMTVALRACDGNVPRAAALLEVSPSTIYRRIRQFGDPVTGAPPSEVGGAAGKAKG